jgi:hypothetical protein
MIRKTTKAPTNTFVEQLNKLPPVNAVIQHHLTIQNYIAAFDLLSTLDNADQFTEQIIKDIFNKMSNNGEEIGLGVVATLDAVERVIATLQRMADN